MRNKVYLLALLVFSVFSLLSLKRAFAEIKIPFDLWNFKTVTKGQVLSHDFELYNTGRDDITLDHVEASCGCTVTILPSVFVPAGGMIFVHVELDSAAIKENGDFRRNILIFPDPGKADSVKLTLSGTLVSSPEPKIEVREPFIDLGLFFMGQKKLFELEVTNIGDAELTLTGFSGIKCLSEPSELSVKKGGRRLLLFSFTPKLKKGTFSETFFISSNDPDRPKEYLKISGFVLEQKAAIIYRDSGNLFIVNGFEKGIRVKDSKGNVSKVGVLSTVKLGTDEHFTLLMPSQSSKNKK